MAGTCSFEDIHLENLGYCPNEETVGGVKTEVAYMPMAQLETFTKPTVTNESTYTERLTIPEAGLVPKTGKGFKVIEMMVDENELKNALVGNKGNKKPQASFDALIPNFTPKNLGFIDTHKNTPLLLVITDSTGRKWVMPDSYINTAEGTSGKAYEDNSGITITVTANSKIYTYDGEIEILADVPEI